jgi:LysR family glycine cleavage system transcriptional activator
MDWQSFPSLTGLKAFEATARLKNYSAAARELNVTEAAIRQQVRGLEVFFGKSLVVRSGRGVALTEKGDRLAVSVASAFQGLQAGIEALKNDDDARPLKIALPPAFAENWLMPRLGLFWAEHPDIEIELAPSLKLVDLKEGGFDLAIRYGHGNWPGTRSRYLASADYVVVATKGFMQSRVPVARAESALAEPALAEPTLAEPTLAELRALPWLFESGRREHRIWAEERGIDFQAERNKFYPTNSLVLSAARAGYGLSLQARALVERDLEDGGLIEIHAEATETLGYYLVTGVEQREKLAVFVRWLLGRV